MINLPCLVSTVAYSMNPNEGQNEYEEVQKELRTKDDEAEVCSGISFYCHSKLI